MNALATALTQISRQIAADILDDSLTMGLEAAALLWVEQCAFEYADVPARSRCCDDYRDGGCPECERVECLQYAEATEILRCVLSGLGDPEPCFVGCECGCEARLADAVSTPNTKTARRAA